MCSLSQREALTHLLLPSAGPGDTPGPGCVDRRLSSTTPAIRGGKDEDLHSKSASAHTHILDQHSRVLPLQGIMNREDLQPARVGERFKRQKARGDGKHGGRETSGDGEPAAKPQMMLKETVFGYGGLECSHSTPTQTARPFLKPQVAVCPTSREEPAPRAWGAIVHQHPCS